MADTEASKRFPFINLEKAVSRAQQLYSADQRGSEMSNAGAFAVWDYSEKSSGGFQTIGALRAYGLIEGEESGKIKLSKKAFDYFRDEREETRAAVLRQFALVPPFLRSLWNKWGAHPPADTLARTYLKLERGLNEQSARAVLGIYKDNIAFANLTGDAKLPELKEDKGHSDAARSIKVGDYVQWTSNGVLQFPQPRKVVAIFPDGKHAQVFASNIGIPMNELEVVEPPAPPPPVDHSSAWGQGENEYNVLQKGNRLQITADVDLEGIGELKAMLADYESILKRLTRKSK